MRNSDGDERLQALARLGREARRSEAAVEGPFDDELRDERHHRAYFGRGDGGDQVGVIDDMRAIFGRSYVAEPDRLADELKADEALAEADTLLLTVPNQLGVAYNAHVIEAVLKHVAPALGWR